MTIFHLILITNIIPGEFSVYLTAAILIAISIICYILFLKIKSEKALKLHLQNLQTRLVQIERTTRHNTSIVNNNLADVYSNEKIISLITHDIRSPLCALQNTTKIFEYYIKEENFEQLLQLSREVDMTVSNLNFMLDNLISWNLSRTDRLYSNPTDFLLSDIINQSIEFNKKCADKKNIAVNYFSDQSISLKTDYNLMYTICNNILHNAIKFSMENSFVTIKESQKDDDIMILFSDEGLGINTEQVHAFNKGLQIDQKIGTNGEKGFGFGLSLSKSLAMICNADLSIKTKHPRGTEVTLHFGQEKCNQST